MRQTFAWTALLLLGSALAGGGGGWHEVPPPATTGPVNLTTLTRSGNNLVLAWTQQLGNWQLRAAELSDGQWQPLGLVLNEGQRFNATHLVSRQDADGRAWLGWSEDAGGAHVDSWLMSVWNGQIWQRPTSAVRRNLSDAGLSRSFDVLPNGIPTLAWVDVYVPGAWAASVRPLVWDGKTWLPQPPLNNLKFAGFAPSLRVTASGQRVVALLEGDYATMRVIIKREQAPGQWVLLGQAVNRLPHTFAADPQLIWSPTPMVGWIEGDADSARPDRLYVSRWNGQAWQAVGGQISGPRKVEAYSLALTASSEIRAAWTEGGEIHAARFTGQRWSPLPLPTTQHATGPSLSPDGRYLSFSDQGKLRVINLP